MIERLRGAIEHDDLGETSQRDASCLSARLHRMAAYGALAIIAAIVFGAGSLPPL